MNNELLQEYLNIFEKKQEDIIWVLRQQEKLRLEYIMFLKKDLPEILKRQNIKRHFWNKKIYEETVKKIISDYSEQIQKSLNLLSSELINNIR